MKNLFQRLAFTFLLGLIISFTSSSCKDDKEAYAVEISKADALFQNQQYVDAKAIYLKASSLKKDEAYPKSQISKIDELLVKKIEDKQPKPKTKEVEIAPKIVAVQNAKPFYIIVGSFAVQKNAIGFQKELSAKSQKSTIIRSQEGNYLVSVKSFETITKAYNYLDEEALDLVDSTWVYRAK